MQLRVQLYLVIINMQQEYRSCIREMNWAGDSITGWRRHASVHRKNLPLEFQRHAGREHDGVLHNAEFLELLEQSNESVCRFLIICSFVLKFNFLF